MVNKNNNEKFLLTLLDMTDAVYTSSVDEYMYFYPSKPKSLGFTIKIPFVQGSKSVDINFTVESSSRMQNDEKHVNFSFSSPDEIKDFMAQLYQKHEDMLNNGRVSSEVIAKFEEVLKAPIDNYPYILEGKDESLGIKNKTTDDGIYIGFGRAIYNYEEKRKFKPLEPIVINCYYRENVASPNIMFQKVIPAYMVHEYPIVAKHAYIHKTTKDLHELTDALYEISPKSATALSALILDVELDRNAPVKNSKPKL
jgi:hypothetical protein